MYTLQDDGTGLRQLTNKDLVTYAIGRPKLTQLELELTLRLEQIVHQRHDWYQAVLASPCITCPSFRESAPHFDEVEYDIEGSTTWA